MTAPIKNEALASPTVLRQFLAKLEAKYSETPGNTKLLWQIAQTQRALGEFEQALHYYNCFLHIEPDHQEARYFVALLSGTGHSGPLNGCNSLAPPFLRFNNFLSDEALALLWSAAEERLPKLISSYVGENGSVAVNQSARRSLSTDAGSSIRALFYDRVEEVLKRRRIVEQLGIDHRASLQNLQMSLIAYGDGDFFKPHRDTGAYRGSSLRELTFVYHFFKTPKRFAGGELCLFDAGLEDEEMGPLNNLTCFEPIHNSILFFPSRALHEVRSIQCQSDDLHDGRFAVAGWVSRQEDII